MKDLLGFYFLTKVKGKNSDRWFEERKKKKQGKNERKCEAGNTSTSTSTNTVQEYRGRKFDVDLKGGD